MPNRIIKESICRSDTIDSLSWFEEVLFYRLIVVCDDYGRFDGRPAIIKGSCFPLKDDITKKHISEAIDKLSTVGLIRGYEVQGRPFLQLTTWNCHQQIRAKKSKYPEPAIKDAPSEAVCNQMISDDRNSPRNPIQSESNPNTDTDARANTPMETCTRFPQFWSAYPKKVNELMARGEYERVLKTAKAVTEDMLIQAAKNYAEACAIEGRVDRYVKNPANWLRDLTWIDYAPENYKKPQAKVGRKGNSFGDYPHREYDVDAIKKRMFEQ